MTELYVDSITKRYGMNQVLTDIFIKCREGEIIGVLGRNGSGKSTLLKIIFGSIRSDYKFIKIGNKRINGINDNSDLIKYLPQESFLPGHITVKTIISVFLNAASQEKIANHYLVKQSLQRKVNHLSTGERRLLEILLIINSDAKFVLLDEPFKAVAPVFKEEIIRQIQEQSKIKGFIITDHDYRNILEVASKIILLKDGGIKKIKDKDELKFWGYIN